MHSCRNPAVCAEAASPKLRFGWGVSRRAPHSNGFLDVTVVVVAILAVSDELAVGHDFSRVIGSRHGPPEDQVRL